MFEKIKMIAAIQVPMVVLLPLLLICGVLFILIRKINKETAVKNRDIADRELDTKRQALSAEDGKLAAKERDIAAKDKDIEAKTNRLEYEARMFEAFAACLSSSSNDVYLILNEDREVVYATPNLERVMCRSQEEIAASLRGSHAMDPEELQEFVQQLRTLRPGESAGPVIWEQICTPAGERQYLLEQATCVRIQDKVKVVVYISDRTRECKLRKELVDALRRAQDANNAKSIFLKNASHDMRTPMNAIIGCLSLMRNEVNNPDMVMEYSQQIDTASQHLLELINNVLDMSEIESSGMSLNISELNVAEVVEEIRTIVTPQVQAKNQTFDISVSQLMHEYLQGDKVRIKEILLNILSNAVKYTPEGGTIHLRVEELPQIVKNFSRIRFEIEDNGVGMSQDYQSGLFSPFSREDSQINLTAQGSGLGLAIVKGLLDMMGGGIRVKSEPGKGSTFTIELDLRILARDADSKFWMGRQREVEKSNASADVVRDKCVMIVDDIEINRIVLSKIMSSLGARCDTAADGREALEKFEASQPEEYDLILMDLQMPVLDGCGAARAIRVCSHPSARSIPIIAVTANAFADDVRSALEAGMNAHIAKPIQTNQLKSLLQQVLNSQTVKNI